MLRLYQETTSGEILGLRDKFTVFGVLFSVTHW